MNCRHWRKCGGINMRGKKTYTIWEGRYVDDVIENRKEEFLKKQAHLEMAEFIMAPKSR
mgnify:FL=1